VESVTGFVGRDDPLTEALATLRAGNSLLIKGRAGIGKRAFLRQLKARLEAERPCLFPTGASGKLMVQDLAEQAHQAVSLAVPERLVPGRYRARAHQEGRVRWAWIKRTLARLPTRDVLAVVVRSLEGRGVILFLESLEVPPTQAAMLQELAAVCQLAATMDLDNRRVRIQRLLWRFQTTVELKPLTREQTRELAERWLQSRPIRFSSKRVREAFLRAVEQDSGGIPAAIEGMLEAATHDEEVTRAKVRAYRHEAAGRYFDMTPLAIVGMIGFMALRYISRGVGETELLVLSGVGSALFWGLVFLMRALGR
jgi:hypothetical protein